MRRGRALSWTLALLLILAEASGASNPPAAHDSDSLVAYRNEIEAGYNARDASAIETTVAALRKGSSGHKDLAIYYEAFARLRQSAIPGTSRERARRYLDQCIDELEPLLQRRADYAEARALYASCLGASVSYYVLRAATRGVASGREMAAALKLAPDNPWVVFQEAVNDFLTPPMFGGNKQRALGKLQRAEKLFIASRPAGSNTPVFGESETWLYMGRVHLALGQKTEGRKALEKARSLAPGSADVRDELAKL
jgi:hypothetical protein